MADQRFPKSERLCSQKIIASLFDEAKIFYVKGYRVMWTFCALPADVPAQIAFSAPKKIYRSAVKRNLVKRKMREAYRKDKQRLFDKLSSIEKQMAIMIVSLDKQLPSYSEVQNAMTEMIDILVKNASGNI